jgi:hypothetical protein
MIFMNSFLNVAVSVFSPHPGILSDARCKRVSLLFHAPAPLHQQHVTAFSNIIFQAFNEPSSGE